MTDLGFLLLLWLGVICVAILMMAKDQLESFFMPNRCVVIKYYSPATGHSSIVVQTDDPTELLKHINDVGVVKYLKTNYVNTQNAIHVSLIYAKGSVFKQNTRWNRLWDTLTDFGKIMINHPTFLITTFNLVQSYFNRVAVNNDEDDEILINIRERKPSSNEILEMARRESQRNNEMFDSLGLNQMYELCTPFLKDGIIWEILLNKLTDANELSNEEFEKLKKEVDIVFKTFNFDFSTYEKIIEQTKIFLERYKENFKDFDKGDTFDNLNDQLIDKLETHLHANQSDHPDLDEIINDLIKKFDNHIELNKYLSLVIKYLSDLDNNDYKVLLTGYDSKSIEEMISHVPAEHDPIIFSKVTKILGLIKHPNENMQSIEGYCLTLVALTQK